MKRTLWAALAVLIGLAFTGPSVYAGEDYYYGAELYVARANAPVYDCPRPGCQTDIRLRANSYIYAACWDGGEGWCRVKTRYFTHMYLPRYAIDRAYGEYHSKSYYPSQHGSYNDDCYGRGSPYRYGGYKEGCYYKENYPSRPYGYRQGCDSYGGGDCYSKRSYSYAYGEGGYRQKAYANEYRYKGSYKRRDGYDGYDNDYSGYDQED